MKKIWSVVLALVMLLSLLPMGAITASAAYENIYTNTGDYRADIIGVAKTQIGYTEGSNNSNKYGSSFNHNNVEWCAYFVSWCARQAGIPTTVLKTSSRAGHSSSCFNIPVVNHSGACYEQVGCSTNSNYIPKPGDLFFTKSWSHVGLVYYVDGAYFYTIEGNSNSSGSATGTKVCSNRRYIKDYYFGVPNYGDAPTHEVNSSYETNFTAYLKDASQHVPVYNNDHTVQSERYVTGSDPVTIHEVYTDGCCKFSYTTDSGTVRTCYTSYSYFKTHTHSYTSYYESAHPHKVYKKCSCGDWAYTGATKVLSTCSSCWAATTVSFNKSSISLVIPSTQTATLNIQLSAAETWPSGAGYTFDYDSSIISMSQNGAVLTLTAKKAGSTNFTMKIVDKNNNNALIKSAVCPITVRNATYTISYNANGGTGAPSSQTKTYDVPLTLSKTTPKRTGYTFMGWSTSSSATTASYIPGDRFIRDSNTTLYAVWKNAAQLYCNDRYSSPISYGNQEYYFKFTPSQSGKYVIYSEATKDTKVYLYNSSGTLITSNDDGGEGNNFRLAYNLTAGSTYYYGIKFYSSSQIGSITFAFGEVGSIKYNANGGTGAPSEQEVDYGKRVTISTVKPTRKGYTFLGWSLRSSATTPNYKGGENVQTTSNITCYAVWEADCANNNHDYGYWKYSDSSYHIRSCKNCNFTEKSSHTWGERQYVENLKQYKYFCSGCASEKYVLITEKIEITKLPSKTVYRVGEKFDSTELKVKASFLGDSFAIVSGYSLSGFDSSTIGTKTITVSYNGKTTTFNVTVVCNTHKYTNSCDTKCNVCSATRTITHTYSNNCDKSCNVCGNTRTVGAHKYSNACDTTCNYCNAKRTIKHTYSNSCDTSCNVCKATRTITHAYKTTTTKATLSKNGSIVKKCTVCGKVASKTAIKYAKIFKLSTTTYTYNGKVKTPSITVKDSAGKTLKKNTDYTVTYASGRKNVGTYKVTIKMIGKYSGTKTLNFKINPAKTTVSKLTAGKKSITVAITKKSTQVTGYQIQYSTSKKFTNAKTKTISNYMTTKYTLKSLSAKKTYYVRVRTYKKVGSTTYYSGWSTYKYVKTK